MTTKRNGYSTLRNGSRIVKLVAPKGGVPTHRLSGKVMGKSGDNLAIRFDDQMRLTVIEGARQQFERGLIRKQGRR